MNAAILKHLRANGEQLDAEIAQALRIPMAQLKTQVAELSASGDVICCKVTRFIDGKKIHRIAVNAETRERIQRSELAVVRYLGYHALVPAAIAEQIRERDPQAVVALDLNNPEPTEDDPYKDFQVPDDLMW